MKRFWLFMMFIGAGLLSTVALDTPSFAQSSGGTITLRYAGGMAPMHHITVAMNHWAEAVNKKTNGKVKIEVYPNGQLFHAKQTPEAVASGACDIGEFPSGTLAGLVPSADLDTVGPFFDSWDHMLRVKKAGRAIWEEDFQAHNLKLLFFMPYGEDSGFILRKKKPQKLEDLKGLKIRGFGEANNRMLAALGIVPTFISSPEVYQALQTGTLDGACSGWSTYVTRRWYEIAKFLPDFPAALSVFYTAMNLKKWNSLPKDIQNAILEASAEEEPLILQRAIQDDKDSRKELEKQGVDIYQLSKSEFERWRAKVEPLLEAWGKKNPRNTALVKLVSQYR